MAWFSNNFDRKLFFIAFLLLLGATMEYLKLDFGATILQGSFFAGLALIDPNRGGGMPPAAPPASKP